MQQVVTVSGNQHRNESSGLGVNTSENDEMEWWVAAPITRPRWMTGTFFLDRLHNPRHRLSSPAAAAMGVFRMLKRCDCAGLTNEKVASVLLRRGHAVGWNI